MKRKRATGFACLTPCSKSPAFCDCSAVEKENRQRTPRTERSRKSLKAGGIDREIREIEFSPLKRKQVPRNSQFLETASSRTFELSSDRSLRMFGRANSGSSIR